MGAGAPAPAFALVASDELASLAPTPVPSLAVRGEWSADAERELKKIPFFVRAKARRNTEAYAAEQGLEAIGLDTLYEAKAHYAR